MLHVPGGQFVRGEVSSADASGGIAYTLYTVDGSTRTLLATERLIIYHLNAGTAGGNLGIAVTQNTDVAGKRLFKQTLLDSIPITIDYVRPVECALGVVPKLFTSTAQQVDSQLYGEIVEV